MTRRVPNRSRRSWARCALFLLFLFPLVPSRLAAADPFPGYPEAVREQAVRVVEAAGPGKGEALEREVRALRRAMFDHAILSMNAVPDRIFDRAVREGWKRRSYESMRAVTRVAPLSVPLWSWLAWEDAARFRLEEFLFDVEGLSGALRQYGPGLLGYAVWLVLFASASACWFAVWASLNLLLRARPALTSDVARLFKGLPRPEIFASGDRPRRFRRPGRVRGRDRRRRGLLDRALDRVPAPRRARDRGNGDPAAGRRLPLRRLPRSDSPGGGNGAAGRMAGRGGVLLPAACRAPGMPDRDC